VTRSAARKDRVACVLLAAGGSSRLGRPKQLVRYRGVPLLRRAVAAARAVLPSAPLIFVVGAHALRVRAVLQRSRSGARVVGNALWREGMASSLRAGLAAVPAGSRAALVLLVDQPRVDAASLARLLRAWSKRRGVPAAAHYAGRVGAPAVLPRRRWRALARVDGDRGARAMLRGGGALTLVDMPEAAFDVDTAADLAALTR
jgi:CTP:molybdopterin cytidylyltransferase MocA